MKYLVALIFAVHTSGAAFADACKQKEPEPCSHVTEKNVTFEVTAATQGFYGQLWKVSYTGLKNINVEIDYMLSPMGNLSGTFFVDPAALERIKKVAIEQRFFDLPRKIIADRIPLHAPDLRLTLTVDGKTHKVSLYDPKGLQDSPEAARFLAMWNEVFSSLPMRPSWK